MDNMGHWISTQAVPDDMYGFVYCITNLVNNRMYIGKKQAQTLKKRPPLKGKKRKRTEVVDTDWRTYTSSSTEVNADIEKFGKHNFKFEILRFCDSKSALAYYEAKEQFDREVLLREEYYNGIINLRIGKIKGLQKISQNSEKSCENTLI